MIRVILDTNIIVSALLQPLGPSAQLLMRVMGGSIQLCITGNVYAEYDEVISRPRFRRDPETIAETLQSIRERAFGSSPR
jgi:putative PIN family toxin of toxin-antitoxin system